jgi:hypothetical protein
MIIVHEGFKAAANYPAISLRDKGLTDTIQRVFGTFFGKKFSVNGISPMNETYSREGILREILVESIDKQKEKYDLLTLVLETEGGLTTTFMGSKPFEPRVGRVYVTRPYENARQVLLFQNVPISEIYDRLVLKKLMNFAQ